MADATLQSLLSTKAALDLGLISQVGCCGWQGWTMLPNQACKDCTRHAMHMPPAIRLRSPALLYPHGALVC